MWLKEQELLETEAEEWWEAQNFEGHFFLMSEWMKPRRVGTHAPEGIETPDLDGWAYSMARGYGEEAGTTRHNDGGTTE